MRAIFHACGLRIGANRIIPGLIPDPGAAPVDLEIHLGSMPGGVSETSPWDLDEPGCPEPFSLPANGGNSFRLRYDDDTRFVVDASGSTIWAAWPRTSTLEDTVVYLLGPVLAFVLRLRGITCLHASAFSVDGRVVAIVGPSGAGKSTTAAAFAARGFAVLSDDMLVLKDQGEEVIAHPGYPRLRLWPDAVTTLYGTAAALPRLTPNWDKCYLELSVDQGTFERRPLPLSAIYCLEDRTDEPSAPIVEALAPSTSLLRLLANARDDFHLDKASRRRDFDMLGQIARRVRMRRVAARRWPKPIGKPV